MGKVRKKRFRYRHDPTSEGIQSSFKARSSALPSSDLQAIDHSESGKVPLTEKLFSEKEAEREWACHAVAHLVTDAASARKLVGADLVARLTWLLEDRVWEVREAAVGALRNLSAINDGLHCEKLVKGSIMRPLIALIRQCGDLMLKSGGSEEDMVPPFYQILDHCLNLLLNLSESTGAAVEEFNKESAIHCLLQIVSAYDLPISLRTVTAQCLQTVTEDNPVAIQCITSSPDLLNSLEGALTSFSPSSNSTQVAMVRISLIGVLQNILLGLADHSQAVHLIVETLTNVLDVSPEHICQSLSEVHHEDRELMVPAFAQLRDQLRCVQMALESLANLCYIEDESEDEGEWEDVEDEMEGVVTSEEGVVPDMPEAPAAQQLALSLLCDRKVHHKLLSWCIQDFSIIPLASKEMLTRLHCIQERAAVALLNMTTSLPANAEWWGGHSGLAEIWPIIFQALSSAAGESSLPTCQEDTLVAYLGVIGELANRFNSARVCIAVSMDHEKCMMNLCHRAFLPAVRAAAISALGWLGRMSLHANPLERFRALTAITSALCECMAGDPSLLVICEALDAMFDILGSDDCPVEVVRSPTLLPLLKKTKSEFRTKLHRDKHYLKPHMGLVNTTRINLPKFIVYLENM